MSAPAATLTTITTQLVSAFEAAWRAIQQRHPDVPEVVVTFGSGTLGMKAGQTRLGHFAAARWQHGEKQLPELFISGEGLQRGALEVLGTLLHEAAHGLAHVREIKDTSRQGRYHNAKFKALGEEVGLTLAEDKTIGWSLTTVLMIGGAVRGVSMVRDWTSASSAAAISAEVGGGGARPGSVSRAPSS